MRRQGWAGPLPAHHVSKRLLPAANERRAGANTQSSRPAAHHSKAVGKDALLLQPLCRHSRLRLCCSAPCRHTFERCCRCHLCRPLGCCSHVLQRPLNSHHCQAHRQRLAAWVGWLGANQPAGRHPLDGANANKAIKQAWHAHQATVQEALPQCQASHPASHTLRHRTCRGRRGSRRPPERRAPQQPGDVELVVLQYFINIPRSAGEVHLKLLDLQGEGRMSMGRVARNRAGRSQGTGFYMRKGFAQSGGCRLAAGSKERSATPRSINL